MEKKDIVLEEASEKSKLLSEKLLDVCDDFSLKNKSSGTEIYAAICFLKYKMEYIIEKQYGYEILQRMMQSVKIIDINKN
jgi:hypothetical protein